MKKFSNCFLALFILLMLSAVPVSAGTPVTQEKELIGRTTTNLANDAVYTSDVKLTTGFGRVTVIVEASHNSATDGVVIQQSGDADCNTNTPASVNWDYESKYTYTAGSENNGYSVEIIGRCVRVSYTNGGTTTTTLRIYSGLKTF